MVIARTDFAPDTSEASDWFPREAVLNVQTYLRSGKTLDDLKVEYGISANRHRTCQNLVGLKYSQIDSPRGNPLVNECRGLVLDEADNWTVVCRGFDRFFNLGEGVAAEIDWSTARVQEKVDGTLLLMYVYGGDWHVATTGTPDASGEVNGWPYTFSDLFYETLERHLGDNGDPDRFWDAAESIGDFEIHGKAELTYCFELTAPENRVVVPHTTKSLTLLGVRHTRSGKWISCGPVSQLTGVPIVKEFPLTSFDECIATFATLDGLHNEGYVVVDGGGNRVKVKHPGYIAYHHLKDTAGASPRAIVELVRRGEAPEGLIAFPEFTDAFTDAERRLDRAVAGIEAVYRVLKDIESQKEFALFAGKSAFPAILFQLRSGRLKTAREFFETAHIDQVMRLLDIQTSSNVRRYPSDGLDGR